MLAEIVGNTRRELALRMHLRSTVTLRATTAPTTRSFAAALRSRRPALILECKQAAPSKGRLRTHFDPDEIADAYAGVADAVSVVTEPRYFGGSHAQLAALRARLDLPLLCKDFVVDPYQVYEARAAGADAILLMLSVLDDDGYRACAAAAAALGMDALIEVRDHAELERALALGAAIIGINNRDLATLAVDLDTTRRLAPQVPRGVLVVSESGIDDRATLRTLPARVDAVLIGSSLMAAPHLGRAARALAYGRVKVCGLRRAEDARAAWQAGATYAGINLVATSPRVVTIPQAQAVRTASPMLPVGVFVDAPLAQVVEQARCLELHAVQLHGHETADYARALRAALPGIAIWQARPVSDSLPEPAADADLTLLDAAHPSLRGGTGQRFDWSLLRDAGEAARFVLAGGIDPATAARADALGCHALDICSGVESAPGVKDPVRLEALFAALRAASGQAA